MKNIKCYEFRGETLTAKEISEKYLIPDRLVWKAFNDKKLPSLEEMLVWRKANGINDIKDFRCRSTQQGTPGKNHGKKRTYSFKFKIEDNPLLNTQRPSLPEYYIKPNVGHNNGFFVGELFGSYYVISIHNRNNRRYCSVQCTECGKLIYDIPSSVFLSLCDTGCSCRKFCHANILKNLPSSLIKNALLDDKKDIAFYKEFIGHKVCGLLVDSISVKETNDRYEYIFTATCSKCGGHFTTLAFNLITGNFHHKCKCSKKKASILKNSSCIIHNKNSMFRTCHGANDLSEDMKDILRSHISFYTLRFGTEDFMNMCIDAKLSGKGEVLYNVFGI